jgi:hypothetical protein
MATVPIGGTQRVIFLRQIVLPTIGAKAAFENGLPKLSRCSGG